MPDYEVGHSFDLDSAEAPGAKGSRPETGAPPPGPAEPHAPRVKSAVSLFFSYLLVPVPEVSLILAFLAVIYGCQDSPRRGLKMLIFSPFLQVPIFSFVAGLLCFVTAPSDHGRSSPRDHYLAIIEGRQAANRTRSGSRWPDAEALYKAPFDQALRILHRTFDTKEADETESCRRFWWVWEAIDRTAEKIPYLTFIQDPERYGCPRSVNLTSLRIPRVSCLSELAIIPVAGTHLIIGSTEGANIFSLESGELIYDYDFDDLYPHVQTCAEDD